VVEHAVENEDDQGQSHEYRTQKCHLQCQRSRVGGVKERQESRKENGQLGIQNTDQKSLERDSSHSPAGAGIIQFQRTGFPPHGPYQSEQVQSTRDFHGLKGQGTGVKTEHS